MEKGLRTLLFILLTKLRKTATNKNGIKFAVVFGGWFEGCQTFSLPFFLPARQEILRSFSPLN
jgi:hypothetical protein